MDIVATLDSSNLVSPRQSMDTIFAKAEFKENAKFGLLPNCVMRVKYLPSFITYRYPKHKE